MPIDSVSKYVDDFCLVMQLFEQFSRPKNSSSEFDIRGKNTWDEVIRAARLAEAEYHASVKGTKGALRKFFRLTGDYSPALEPWVGFLPNDKYMAVLCGGLKVILVVC